MATFVLLHGGGAGSWIWRHTEAELRERGHDVLTVTFTGFGERRHLITAQSTIEMHVVDVLNALEFGDVNDAVLVAHSYSGTVAPGVVAAAGSRLRKIVYLDAVILKQGETVVEAMGYMSTEQARATHVGVKSGAIPLYAPVAAQQRAEAAEKPYRMSAERQQWMLDHLIDMPLAATVTPVLVGSEAIDRPVDYIAVSDTVMKPVMHKRAKELGWRMHEVEGDHVIMVGEPVTTAALLERLA